MSFDLRAQRLGGISPGWRLDRLPVLAHARGAVGPEFGHVRTVDDVEKRAGADAHLDQGAEGEVDQIDHGVGLVDDVGGLDKLVDLLAHPGHAPVRPRRLQELGTAGNRMPKTAVELRNLIERIIETHRSFMPEVHHSSMHEITAHLFNLPIPLLEKIIRPILVYVFLVVLLRIFGKRELAQLNPFDLVVLLSLSNTVQNAIIGDDNSVAGGIVGAVTLLVTNYIVVRFLFRHRRLDEVLEGKPSTLIKDGTMRKKEMARELITKSELQTVVRRQGFDGIDAVESCVLEPGGAFIIKPKSPPADELRHNELLQRLDALTAQIAAVEQKMAAR